MGEGVGGALSILSMLVAFAGILVLAYFTTRLMGKRLPGGSPCAGQMKVLDRLPLGQDKALLIVQVAGRTLLLGVAAHAVSLLCTLDAGEIELPPTQENAPFMGILKDMIKNRGMKEPEQRKETDEQG